MKRLCVIIPSLPFGLRYWRYVFEEVAKLGLQVNLVTACPPKDSVEFSLACVASRSFVEKRRVDGYIKAFTYISPKLVMAVFKARPDVIFVVEYTMATAYAVVAGKLLRTPVIIFKENASRKEFKPGFFKKLYQKVLVSSADRIIANTDGAKKEIEQLFGVLGSKLACGPLLVPPNRADLIRCPLALPEVRNRPLFLYLGQLVQRKNVQALLQASHILASKDLAFSVWLVGGGSLRSNLEEMVQNFGLADRVTFLGNIPYESIGFVYQRADVFVMPTFSDYRSVSVLEAMRFGKAVLDSIGDGNAHDTVRSNENGHIFDPYNPDALAEQMKRFIDHPSLISAMGERSKEIMDVQTPEIAARHLAGVVESVLDNNQERGRRF